MSNVEFWSDFWLMFSGQFDSFYLTLLYSISLPVNETATLLWLITPLINFFLCGIKENSLLNYTEIGYELTYLITDTLVYIYSPVMP